MYSRGTAAIHRAARRACRVAAWLVCAGCTAEPATVPIEQAPAPPRREPTPTPTATTSRDLRLPAAQVPTVAAPVEPAEVAPAEGGPRVVPPGTPPANARAFQRIPVALQDGPPVGGIGASGIHVDKIWLGSAYEREGCTGEGERFSLERHRQVNVCFRVVHSRAEEGAEVLWEKDGAPFRRRPVTIPDLHAYRTRAYLVLRPEYVGQWAARVVSSEGVELGSASFVVVP